MELSIAIIINNSKSLVINLLNNLKDINCKQLLLINGILNVQIIDIIETYANQKNDVKIIKSDKILRYPIAMNMLLKEVKTKYVFKMDSDMLTTEKDLKGIYDFIEKNKNYGAVQGLLIYPQTNRIQSTGHIFHEFWENYGKYKGFINDYNKPMERQSLSAGFAMCQMDIVRSIGYYDEFYLYHMCGMEFSTRMKFEGYNLCCLPTSKGYHFHSLFRKKFDDFSVKEINKYWATYGSFLKNDLHKEILSSDYFIDFSSYHIIDCSTISDLSSFLETIKIKNSNIMLKITDRVDNEILLQNVLPYSVLQSSKKILWICTHYEQLVNNHLVFANINRSNDFIIDMSANVIPAKLLF